jgi:hypothetical protein
MLWMSIICLNQHVCTVWTHSDNYNVYYLRKLPYFDLIPYNFDIILYCETCRKLWKIVGNCWFLGERLNINCAVYMDIFLNIILSYYTFGNLCQCVCPAMRFCSSQQIFSKLGEHILSVMTRGVCYILLVCTYYAHVHVRPKHERMCMFAYFWTDYFQICCDHITNTWAKHFACSSTVHAWASACVWAHARLSVRLSVDGLSPNLF